MKYQFHHQIAIEGCVGAGKTTWARALASARQTCFVLEDFDKNPFLSAFYADPVGNVLETELQFLLTHYHQLKQIPLRSNKVTETITDFAFFKDIIFADTNIMDHAEKRMFDTLYNFLSAKLRPPDLVIYLRGSDKLILDRIRQRNRSMEMQIDEAYFIRLNRAYEHFFSRFEGSLRIVDADQWDCMTQNEAVQEISKVIDSAMGVQRGLNVHTNP